MQYFINKENNALYIKVNYVFYPFCLSHALRDIKSKAKNSAVTLSEGDIHKYGLCYNNVTETLTEVTVSQLTAMANK